MLYALPGTALVSMPMQTLCVSRAFEVHQVAARHWKCVSNNVCASLIDRLARCGLLVWVVYATSCILGFGAGVLHTRSKQ